MANPADTTDVDTLLAEADALTEHAAAAIAQEQTSEAEPSTQAEAVSAESAGESDQSGTSDQSVKPASGLGSTLDDLDNLLEELGEKPQVVPGEETTETAASPADADEGSPAAAEPAPAAASTNPYAGEVAKMEQEWAAAANGGGSPSSSPAATVAEPKPDAAGGQDDATDEPARSVPVRILHILAAPAAGTLAIMDIPFARLSPWIKGLLGYAALATLAVATALWFAGPSLIHLPILAAAASSAASEGESSGEGSHGSASGKKASSSGSHSAAKEAKPASEGAHSSEKSSKASNSSSHSSSKSEKSSGSSSHSSGKDAKKSGGGKHAPAKKSH